MHSAESVSGRIAEVYKMSESTRLVRDDVYEEMASAYQCLLASILDEKLREHGMAAVDSRRGICSSFLFELGVLHDQGWFQTSAGSAPVYPLLCFSQTFLNTDTPVESIGDVFAAAEFFAYEEYAFGNAASFYDGDAEARINHGCVGNEP